jgi:glutamate synthase domain-containing protein 3
MTSAQQHFDALVHLDMTELAKETAVNDTAHLLTHYGFDLGSDSIEHLIDRWLRSYPRFWLRSAAIEALYQGRYKAFSVEQILAVWRRKGQPLPHFNHEFERIVCNQSPSHLTPARELLPEVESVSIDSTRPELSKWLDAELDIPDAKNQANSDRSALNAEGVAVLNFESAIALESEQSWALAQYSLKVMTTDTSVASAEEQDRLIHQPIHQFVPAPVTSAFYHKLKAVAQEGDRFPSRFP